MNWKRGGLALVMTAVATIFGAGCEKNSAEGPAERAGKALDQVVEEADKDLREAAAETKEAIKDAADEVKDAVDDDNP